MKESIEPTKPTKTVDSRRVAGSDTPSPIATQVAAWRRSFVVLLIVFVVVSASFLGAGSYWLISQTEDSIESVTSTSVDGNQTVTREETDIAAVAEKVKASVVSITTSIQTRSFYGTVSGTGAGTGIVVSSDGYVMTNNHVIDGGTDLTVIDSDGNEYNDVKVIGRDPLNDVAFLKVTSDHTFSPAKIGNSSTVRIGQQVVAIGNALGQYQNTVTSGILSGTGRPVTASDSSGKAESLVDLLQTDASINSGNSGGPLLNLSGQVIGINTAIAEDANGIGFAIPINAVKGILTGVLRDGKVERSYLGVNYLSITPEVAKEYNLSVKQGAFIYNEQQDSAVVDGSPAAKAGLKDRDIIQKVGDETVGAQAGLSSILGQYRTGDTVKLSVLRDGKPISISVTLSSYQPQG